MDVAVFSTKPYDQQFFDQANEGCKHKLQFFEPRLTIDTVSLAAGYPCVCVFVNDVVDRPVLERLASEGLQLVALRCAGFNNVDLEAAKRLGVAVVRVPAYSANAVAEHAVALLLSLNRQIHRAYNRVREGNFALDGLLGFDLCERTVGVVGTGKIGEVFLKILGGFGCRLMAFDVRKNPNCEAMGVEYVSLDKLYRECDLISLHCPLTPETHHLIDQTAINQMRPGVMLINTSRGAIIETSAVIEALKSGKIGSLGIDVYEEEADLFFEDLSNTVIRDDQFARLLTFPNVLVTGHQAFFTREALGEIASTTLGNVNEFATNGTCANQVAAS